jgi:hypothetical protein
MGQPIAACKIGSGVGAPSTLRITGRVLVLLPGTAFSWYAGRHDTDTCISSPFGPRVLPNEPRAGSYHYGVDLPAPAGAPVLATAPVTVIRIQKKGPGGLEMLVQHDGFVGIYSQFGMVICRHSPSASAAFRLARSWGWWEIPVSRPVRICIL